MANPFAKGWKYLTASLDQKIDENADPMVQIKQATDAAKDQHQKISEQAASVIGNKNQLEMKLNRLLTDQKDLQQKARNAIEVSDNEADPVKKQESLNVAEIYATQLVSVEQQIEETKALHSQAVSASEQATRQVKESEARLHEQLGQIDQLSSQVKQTKMQEASTKAMDQITALDPDRDVPSLDQVREKIERRYADALGAQELMHNTMGDRIQEIDAAGADMRASARLEEIRAQMRGQLDAAEQPAKELKSGEGEVENSAKDEAPQDDAAPAAPAGEKDEKSEKEEKSAE
ncbi:PspA/IM30 family protein [Corynebacterium ulcerans]|uniref:PspA/IM30 family protein n=1 Tax=Corynebacterium ulcerans TaxID=65058 RepID=UPI0002141C5A|nr:PspA/IM30 family protein [Corynebacterium ulcerans]AEG82627.1 rod-shaped morphology protein [Corynebacterium ulcerans 809]AEG84962.1 rod-shaped morphology protein [Corynebacterium ulcerans BR-AD22]MBH5297761.1 PspA/IM30 family protein [Corynebacterium ulcerans]NOL58965.1 PspA/IM30 family protein [Corynebacterium ulcerans]NOM03194.1 PspA/IM30 family protein [Corynebacterium ulcerans]